METNPHGQEFFDPDYVARYERLYGSDVYDYRFVNQLMADASLDDCVLDAGCGLGNCSLYLKLRGYRVESVDKSPAMLDRARQQPLSFLNMQQMDITHLGYRSESFDRLISLFAINHIPTTEIEKTLGEFHRVMRDDGKALIAVPVGPADVIKLDDLQLSKRVLLNFFTPDRLNPFLERVGFSIVDQVLVEIDDRMAMSKRLMYTYVEK